jgi:uncharacterized protein (TIGR03437 family)
MPWMKELWKLTAFWALSGTCMASTSPPLKVYVTYLGGSFADTITGMAVDSSGSQYVAGSTNSPDFPLTSTALGVPSETNGCTFVTKFNPTGTAIEFSTCVANSGASAFAVDVNGNMYLAGASVLKLDPTGQQILYNTPIVVASPEAMTVDSMGNVYLTGSAGSGLVTTPGAYQPKLNSGQCLGINSSQPCPNAFVMKLNPSGAVLWATYLGGAGPDDAHAIAIDSTGNVWIAGETVSPNFPVTPNAFDASFGGEVDLGPLRYGDAFVAELDPTGSKLLYSTYLGGSAPDAAFAISVDGTGAAYIAGGTSSANFPTTAGALQTAYSGATPAIPTTGGNAFVTKFDSSGQVVYSTFVGTTPTEATAIAVNAQGQAAVNAPAASLMTQATTCTGQPAITVLNAAGSAVAAFSSVTGNYLAMDSNGGLYSAGTTRTLAFLSTPHAFQTRYGGGDSDGSAGKVDLSQPAGPELDSVVNAASFEGGNGVGAVAPGEIVTLFGNGFGSQPSVNFDEFPAPILYVSNCQIDAVVPFSVNPGMPLFTGPFSTSSTFVSVASGDETIGPMELPVDAAVPGIFTVTGTGTGQAAVINQDGTLNSASNPAPRGSIIAVYVTGTGALSPQIPDGSLGPSTPPFPAPVINISAQIGSSAAPIVFAGQAPTLIAGLTQVNVQIPPDAPTGPSIPITIQAGGYSTSVMTPNISTPESQAFVAVQ